MTTKTEQMERGALLSDANQTAVFLDRNAEDHPDMDIFWQAANIMRALIESYETLQTENIAATSAIRRTANALHRGNTDDALATVDRALKHFAS